MAKVVGHRGASAHAIENTLSSFAKAIELGAHMTEMDVFMTKDNKVIVYHDHNLQRLTGLDREISDLTLTELKALKINGEETIPTLQEVINLCKGKIQMMIELKGPGTGVPVSELIDKNQILDDVLVVSFQAGYLAPIRKVNPEVKLGLLIRHYSYFFLNPTAKRVWKTVDNLDLAYIGPRSHLVSKKMITMAHSRGVKVYSYAVRNKKLGKRMLEWNIDAIGTDNPEWFL